jgi:hypothetical protein
MNKYIKLYEEHNIDGAIENANYSWADIRNTMQNKMPFIIVDFLNLESFTKCKDSDLVDKKYMEQIYNFKDDQNPIKLRSVFIFGLDGDPIDIAKKYQNEHGAKRVIIGEKGKDFPTMFDGGESGEFGNDLLISLDPEDFGMDDYYKVGSQLYKFIST